MTVKTLKLVYFSPTKTSEKVARSIASGMNVSRMEVYDLTPPDGETAEVSCSENDFAVFAVPVYAGRVPVEAAARLKRFRGRNAPAAVVVVYGNRAYEDALLELKNIALESGFKPIAAGAFIGEHSFSGDKFPIATGRPDEADRKQAKRFGERIAEKLKGQGLEPIDVPGNYPYGEGIAPSKASASTDDSLCTMCESCGAVCPTGSISYATHVITDSDTPCRRGPYGSRHCLRGRDGSRKIAPFPRRLSCLSETDACISRLHSLLMRTR